MQLLVAFINNIGLIVMDDKEETYPCTLEALTCYIIYKYIKLGLYQNLINIY